MLLVSKSALVQAAPLIIGRVEVLPHRRSEVIGGKYIIQYMFSAGSSAVIVPAINKIGVGWAFSIGKLLIIYIPGRS